MNKLPLDKTLSESFSLGFKNFFPVLGVFVLYILTIWIPYINIGTTIAVEALPLKMISGEKINPLYIFESKYRKLMGDYLILLVIEFFCILVALCFMVVPMFVLALAWCLATLLFIDKGIAPLEALRKSNEMTYGYKWRIFAIGLVVSLIFGLIFGFLAIPFFIATSLPENIAVGIVQCIAGLFLFPVSMGVNAVIYRNLSAEEAPKADEPKTEEIIINEVKIEE